MAYVRAFKVRAPVLLPQPYLLLPPPLSLFAYRSGWTKFPSAPHTPALVTPALSTGPRFPTLWSEQMNKGTRIHAGSPRCWGYQSIAGTVPDSEFYSLDQGFPIFFPLSILERKPKINLMLNLVSPKWNKLNTVNNILKLKHFWTSEDHEPW